MSNEMDSTGEEYRRRWSADADIMGYDNDGEPAVHCMFIVVARSKLYKIYVSDIQV